MSFSSQSAKKSEVEKTNSLLKEGLKELNRAEEITDNTSKKLTEQNEKIDNAINNVDKSQQSANNSLYITRGLKSFWGQVVNYFTKPTKVEEDEDLQKIRSEQQQNQEVSTEQVESQQRIQKGLNQLPKEATHSQVQNELLDEMNNNVERLIKKQRLIGKELDLQNQKLSKMEDKNDKLQDTMIKINSNIKKI